MDSLFKRVLAYCLDMLLIMFIASNISFSKINFQFDNYRKYSNELIDFRKLYREQQNNDIDTCDDLKKAIDEEKMTEEEYITLYNELEDKKPELSDADYEEKCQVIVNDYNDNKLTYNEYINKVNSYEQKKEANYIVANFIQLFLIFAYFVLFQGFTGGQTLGKKIMRLKVVSTTDDELGYGQLALRTLFLYEVLFTISKMIVSLSVPLPYYALVYNICYYIFYCLLTLAVALTVCFNKDKRGIHDRIARTKVVMMDFNGNVVEEKPLINFGNSKRTKKSKEKKK